MSSSSVNSSEITFGTITPPVISGDDNDTYIVTSDGTSTGTPTEMWKYDSDTDQRVQVPTGGTTCPGPMTRAALLALRNAGTLNKDCHYVITNPDANGTLTAQSIILHAVDATTLSMQAGIKTSHDNIAWQGIYDIDADDVLEVTDNLQNNVQENASIITFPFGVALVTNNKVLDGNVTYVGGTFTQNVVDGNANVTINSGVVARNHFEAASNTTITSSDFLENRVEGDATVISTTTGDVDNNIFRADSNTTINSGNFDANEVHSDANVLVNGAAAVARNHFHAASNTTLNSGDFRDNTVANDATVVSSTSGDVDFNVFGNLSNSNFSGACNFDNSVVDTDANVTMTGGTVQNSRFEQLSNYTMSGGILRESTVGQDADVILISGDNYENVFGKSTVYTQVGTGYIRYSNIEGTTTWTNGNTNISNVNADTATVNTTGSSGTIANSILQRAYMLNLQNIPSLTIIDSTISDYAQVNATGASRLYVYRSSVSSGGRLLVSASRRLDMSYTSLDSYSYIQVTNGVLTANYSKISSLGNIQHTSTGTNRIDRCTITSQSNMRFLGTSTGCQIYYSTASDGSSISHLGTSTNCYVYYCNANANSNIYTNNSINARIYYNAAQRGTIYSQGNTTTHYIYYCNANSAGQIIMINNTASVRMYSISSSSQSIARLQNSTVAANWYYSDFDSYYYAYVTFTTAGTRSGFFGKGRRTRTITNPVKVLPTLNINYFDNL